jgi:mannan endo-1,4-beta-mannosidase
LRSQVSPGVYNEQVFQSLDVILEEARRFGIKVILSVVDNWKYPGGVDQYVDWSRTTPPRTRQRPPDSEGDVDTNVSRCR